MTKRNPRKRVRCRQCKQLRTKNVASEVDCVICPKCHKPMHQAILCDSCGWDTSYPTEQDEDGNWPALDPEPRQIYVARLPDKRYVCHGEVWESLDAIVNGLDLFFKPYMLIVKDADAATAAFWTRGSQRQECSEGTEGQDRKNYSDTQDRKHYT